MMTIEEVKNISFRRSGKSGYNAEDVDRFIDEVLVTLRQYESEKSDIMKKIEILAKKIEKYRADEDIIKNALIKSERIAENARTEAQQEADKIIADAKVKAQGIIGDAQKDAVIQKNDLDKIKRENSEFRAKLLEMYKKQVLLISELPEEAPKAEPEIQREPVSEEPAEISNAAEEPAEAVNDSASEEIKRVPLTPPAPAATDTNIAVPHSYPVRTESENIDDDLDFDEMIPAKEEKKRHRFSVLKFGDNYDMDEDE